MDYIISVKKDAHDYEYIERIISNYGMMYLLAPMITPASLRITFFKGNISKMSIKNFKIIAN